MTYVRSGDDGSPHGFRRLVVQAFRMPILEPQEERLLSRRAEAGDKDAMDRLVGSHLRYVISIARHYRGWGLPMSDLVQEGTLGLVCAVRRFDPDRDVRLASYASWWIRSAIHEYVLRSWSVVRLGTSNAQKMLAFKLKRMAGNWGEDMASFADEQMTQLAEQLGTTLAEVKRLALRMTGRDASLEQGSAAGRSLFDRLISDWPTPEQVVARMAESRLIIESVRAAVERLTPREQLVIRKRYLEDARHTFDAIGRELGLSKDRVRQLEKGAVAKLETLLAPLRAKLS
jgi:RNA polymerase sigma factor, sigma-70 family